MNDDPLIDPTAALTSLGQAMVNMHEIYRSAVAAGFTDAQAMAIVLEMIRTLTPKPDSAG
jgi:hypothetical protein